MCRIGKIVLILDFICKFFFNFFISVSCWCELHLLPKTAKIMTYKWMYGEAVVYEKSQCNVLSSSNINVFLSNTCYYMRQHTFVQRHLKHTPVPSNMTKKSEAFPLISLKQCIQATLHH